MQQDVTWRAGMGPGVWGEFGVCSVPFGLVALGLVAPALNYGSRGHGRVEPAPRAARAGRLTPTTWPWGA